MTYPESSVPDEGVPADRVTDESARARSFGAVGAEYERVRPGYPTRVYDAIVEYLGGRPPYAIEVGSGTGKATVELASRCGRLLAVEPDPRMADVLAQRCGQLSNVRLRVVSFEQLDVTDTADLAASAQAWHWTDPDTRWTTAATLLRLGGVLALWWNNIDVADPDTRQVLVSANRRHAPDLAPQDRATSPRPVSTVDPGWPRAELDADPAFTDVRSESMSVQRAYPVEDYLTLLASMSQYQVLDAGRRTALFAAGPSWSRSSP